MTPLLVTTRNEHHKVFSTCEAVTSMPTTLNEHHNDFSMKTILNEAHNDYSTGNDPK